MASYCNLTTISTRCPAHTHMKHTHTAFCICFNTRGCNIRTVRVSLYTLSPNFVLQISRIGSDDTSLLPDLLQKTSSSSSPTHNPLGQQRQTHKLSYSQLPTAPRSPTHQELHVSSVGGECVCVCVVRQTQLCIKSVQVSPRGNTSRLYKSQRCEV